LVKLDLRKYSYFSLKITLDYLNKILILKKLQKKLDTQFNSISSYVWYVFLHKLLKVALEIVMVD